MFRQIFNLFLKFLKIIDLPSQNKQNLSSTESPTNQTKIFPENKPAKSYNHNNSPVGEYIPTKKQQFSTNTSSKLCHEIGNYILFPAITISSEIQSNIARNKKKNTYFFPIISSLICNTDNEILKILRATKISTTIIWVILCFNCLALQNLTSSCWRGIVLPPSIRDP